MTLLTEGDTIEAKCAFWKRTHPYAAKLRMPTLGVFVEYDGHYWAQRGSWVNVETDKPLYLLEQFDSKDGTHRAVACDTEEEAREAGNAGKWSRVVTTNT